MNSGLCWVEIALVAEVAVDLVDALEAADDQALQVQLRRDAQEEVHVERVVVRHEGPRRRAAGDGLHHRRLDFDVAARVELTAKGGDNFGAGDERFANVGVGDEIEIALPDAGFHVLEAMELLWH